MEHEQKRTIGVLFFLSFFSIWTWNWNWNWDQSIFVFMLYQHHDTAAIPYSLRDLFQDIDPARA